MDAKIQPLTLNPATLTGLSPRLITSHHQNNYGGAVKRLNAIRTELGQLRFTEVPGYRLNGLKREELIAANSMLLHELYFASLGGDGATMVPGLQLALQISFGSEDRWRDEFIAMGKSLAGGSGWVLLTFQPREGTLVNQWATDHTHALAGGVPILALDMYEHAYHMDYGAAASGYVDAFMRNIDWVGVHLRYQTAVNGASESHAATPDELEDAVLIDVRRREAYEASSLSIPGSRWRDPAQLMRWCSELPADLDIVVYCVHGHEVSRACAMQLRAAGLKARFLRGGLEGWRVSERPMASKGTVS
jgi:superoxide dismutase, Fe-Mn family